MLPTVEDIRKPNPMSESINRFVNPLDTEIKKIYKAYLNKERELYLITNSHLHLRKNYSDLSCEGLIKELFELGRICEFNIKLENFVTLNIRGVRFILEKFDAVLGGVYGRIKDKYLAKKLETNNSDLLYMIQFKMIDESSAIIDDLVNEVEWRYEAGIKLLRKTKDSQLQQSLISINESSINNLGDSEALTKTDIPLLNEAYNKHKGFIKASIESIDLSSQQFKSDFLNWNDTFKWRIKSLTNLATNRNQSKLAINDDENIIDDNRANNAFKANHYQQVKKPKPKKVADDTSSQNSNFSEKADRQAENGFSKNQSRNLIIIYFLILITNISVYISYASIGAMIFDKTKSLEDIKNSAWLLALTPLGYLIGCVAFGLLEKYKIAIVLPFFITAVGNLLFSILLFPKKPENQINTIILSLVRLIIGFGSVTISTKNYINEYIPDKLKPKYQDRIHYLNILGIALAFLFTCLSSFYTYKTDMGFFLLERHNISPFALSLLSLLIGFVAWWLFFEPTNEGFMIFNTLISGNLMLVSRYGVSGKLPLTEEDEPSENRSQSSKDRTFNNINRGSLSKQEIMMIDDIDSKLSLINEQNQFTDTNLVQKTLKEIAVRERSSFFKWNFVVLSFLLVESKIIFEVLLVLVGLIAFEHQTEAGNLLWHSMLASVALFLVIPISYLVNSGVVLSGKYVEKNVLLFLKVSVLVFIGLAIGTFQIVEMLWFAFFVLLFLVSVIESITSVLVSKIVPIKYWLYFINPQYLIPVLSAYGRCVAVLMLYLCCYLWNRGVHIALGVLSLIKIISIIIFALNYNNMKVKAIAKLIKDRKELR